MNDRLEASGDEEAQRADAAAARQSGGDGAPSAVASATTSEAAAPAPAPSGAEGALSAAIPVDAGVGEDADISHYLEVVDAPVPVQDQVKLSIDDIIQFHGGGFGRFHWKLWALTGYVSMFHAMNVVSQVFVTVSIEDSLGQDLSDFQLSMLGTVLFFGWFMGSLASGAAADNWGRKRLLLCSIAASAAFDTASLFPLGYPYALLCRFLVGFATGGINASSFTILLEYSDPPSRDTFLIVWHVWFTFGQVTVACIGLVVYEGMGYDRSDSDGALLVLSFVPVFGMSAFALLHFYAPDSARFFLVCGDTDTARKLMDDMVFANTGAPLPAQFVLEEVQPTESRGSLTSIFFPRAYRGKKDAEAGETLVSNTGITPRHKWNMLAMWLIWFTAAMMFYGAMISSSGKERVSLALLLSAIVEVPACTLGMLTNRYMGRRFSTYAGLFVCAACLAILLWLPSSTPEWAELALANLSKFGVGITFNTIFLYITELFPTSVRSVSAGSASAAGRFGALLAPLFIIFGANQGGESLVLFFFASFSAVAGIVAVFLPETQGTSLQDK